MKLTTRKRRLDDRDAEQVDRRTPGAFYVQYVLNIFLETKLF